MARLLVAARLARCCARGRATQFFPSRARYLCQLHARQVHGLISRSENDYNNVFHFDPGRAITLSLKLAEIWVNAVFRGLHSAQDAMQLFENAAEQGVEATLMAAPELMNNGKACLVLWTGYELVVLELSPEQQQAFGVEPNMMIQNQQRTGACHRCRLKRLLESGIAMR